MNNTDFNENDKFEFISGQFLLKYLAFWPYILASLFISILVAFLIIRYSPEVYYSSTKIEILDESQDSEMTLPTAMTIFNRSMINLDNEIGRLGSFRINKIVSSKLKSNFRYFWVGDVREAERHHSDFFNDYSLDINILLDTVTVFSSFDLILSPKNMNISHYDEDGDLISEFDFKSFSTYNVDHPFPFDIEINDKELFEEKDKIIRRIQIYPFEYQVFLNLESLSFDQPIITAKKAFSEGSDQIIISSSSSVRKITEDYLNTLVDVFDKDGISDRQLEYKNTIEFVQERSSYLEDELKIIEAQKQKFKKENKLTDLKFDADYTLNQISTYNSDLFELQSQKELLSLFKEKLSNLNYNFLPINFGLKDNGINELINQYNSIVKDLKRLKNSGAGDKNPTVVNLKIQIENFFNNIQTSVDSYEKSLVLSVEQIMLKEGEFNKFYEDIPEKEKILRTIERQLEIKEALYLLLLQKKEEASINYAVVKPTIKIIDYAMSDIKPISPRKLFILITSSSLGLFLPIFFLSLWFYFDNKVHTRDDISLLNIPILAEIPYIANSDFLINNILSGSRDQLTESIRMLSTNLKFVLKNDETQNILITSTVKGEGKTLISSHISKILSFGSKVILIGSDLRNPQLHKHLGISKDMNKGLSDYLYNDDIIIDDIIFSSSENLDIILSGVIPPNPTELLQKQKFKKLIENLKNSGKYDYIIVDSAPYLLVSDTFQIANLFDCTLSVVRANHTEKAILKYIEENKSVFNNLCLCLNSVGNSQNYGYKYNYQYGYKYGYAYNYGYGYGYGNDED